MHRVGSIGPPAYVRDRARARVWERNMATRCNPVQPGARALHNTKPGGLPMSDRHDEVLDDLADTGWEYAPDGKLLATVRKAGFRITMPNDDDGDGYHYLVARDAPPLVVSLPPLGLRAWWWGWSRATVAVYLGTVKHVEALTVERDALRRMVDDVRRMKREAERRGLVW